MFQPAQFVDAYDTLKGELHFVFCECGIYQQVADLYIANAKAVQVGGADTDVSIRCRNLQGIGQNFCITVVCSFF